MTLEELEDKFYEDADRASDRAFNIECLKHQYKNAGYRDLVFITTCYGVKQVMEAGLGNIVPSWVHCDNISEL